MSHFLCSKPCGCWRPCTPLGPLFFPMNPITAGSPALVRRHDGINKSKLTSARSPKTLLLQNAPQLFSGLRFLSPYVKAKEESKLKTDTQTLGWRKEREKKGTAKCLAVSLRGVKKAERRRNFAVYSEETAVLLWPDAGWQPNLMLPRKSLHQLYNLAYALK